MAIWRINAYETFGFRRGSYSHRHGVADLFADLCNMAADAIANDDDDALERIFEYALWANDQRAENLRSAADIAFFPPLLRDETTVAAVRARLPQSVLVEKQALLDSVEDKQRRRS